MYIVIAVLAFGILIFVHELGHFLVAKACGVKVNEFAMGMGPRLWHKMGKETEYSLRLLPIGGFCAMEGEDGESDNPRAFCSQAPWKRFLILVAGAGMNFLLGFLLVVLLLSSAAGYTSNKIAGFYPDCPYEGTLQAGDRIISVNGRRVYFTANFGEYASMSSDGSQDIVLKRDGRRIKLNGYHMVPVEYTLEDGRTEVKYGIYFDIDPATPISCLQYSWYTAVDFVRMVWQSIVQLFTGRVAATELSGVVGIVDVINETGQNAETVSQGLEDIFYLIAFIAVNLAVMNLLPIPALDGGHCVTLLISWIIEKILGRRLNPKIEAYIHGAGLILLMGLMIFVMVNDVVRIVLR